MSPARNHRTVESNHLHTTNLLTATVYTTISGVAIILSFMALFAFL